MTIYEVLEILNQHYTPNTHLFSDYVLITSDDNGGFLRTCFMKKSQPLKDYNLGDVKYVVVGFQDKFDPSMLKTVEKEDYFSTQTKMQIIFIYDKKDIQPEIEWCKNLTPEDIKVFEL